MKNKFLICGICGWCLELLWTGFTSLRRREMKLMGQSSIWMFPIYSMGALAGPVYNRLKTKNIFVRGLCYMVGIFAVEYAAGSCLKKKECCPWDYSHVRTNINGVIRLDFAPLWFFTGLLFERIAKKKEVSEQ